MLLDDSRTDSSEAQYTSVAGLGRRDTSMSGERRSRCETARRGLIPTGHCWSRTLVSAVRSAIAIPSDQVREATKEVEVFAACRFKIRYFPSSRAQFGHSDPSIDVPPIYEPLIP